MEREITNNNRRNYTSGTGSYNSCNNHFINSAN